MAKSCVDHPSVSRFASRHERSGDWWHPSVAGRRERAVKHAGGRRSRGSIAGGHASWPSPRAGPRRDSIKPSSGSLPAGSKPVVRPSAFQSPDRRSVHRDRVFWLSRPMEKDSNLRLQIQNLMLYPTELSVVQTKGIEPPTSGFFIRCSTAELRPRSDLRSGAVHRAGNTACAGGDESSNRCARSGFRGRERAYSPCGGLSQAALSWRTCGFLRWWYFGNSRRAGISWKTTPTRLAPKGFFS